MNGPDPPLTIIAHSQRILFFFVAFLVYMYPFSSNFFSGRYTLYELHYRFRQIIRSRSTTTRSFIRFTDIGVGK